MATQRYRFRRELPTEIQRLRDKAVDASGAYVAQSQGQIFDIDWDDTYEDDLVQTCEDLGYTLIQGPGVTGVPGDVSEFVRRTGDTMTGNLVFSSGARITGLLTPVADDEPTTKAYVDGLVISGRIWREALLVEQQLLSNGTSSGILQGILGSIATNPSNGDTFIITDGTTTETFTFLNTPAGAFDVQIGGTGLITTTNLVSQINTDSTLWSAVETSGLDDYFTGTPSAQFVIYRTAYSAAADRVYGSLTVSSGIKIVEFATGDQDYTRQAGTEGDLPSSDPAAKRFGFSRTYADLIVVETHLIVEDNTQWTWDQDDRTWRQTGGPSNAAGPSELIFGAGRVLKTTTDRYLYPSYDNGVAQTTVISRVMSTSGTFRNMRVRHNTVGTSTQNIVYTLRINGVATGITVTLAANATSGADTVNTAVFSAGDYVDLIATKSSALTATQPRGIEVTLEMAA